MVRHSRYAFAILTCATIALMGCSTAAERTDTGGSTSESGSSATAKNPTPPQPKRPTSVEVPTGTTLVVALDERLRTDTHKSGDKFSAHTTQSVVIDRTTVFPAGSKVEGHLVLVEEPHRTSGKAQMTLAFDNIVDASGKKHSIETESIVLVGQGDKISDEEKVAGGAVIGGIIGAIAGKDRAKGAATGAAAGAVAGGAIALATKGQQLDLPPGQQFSVEFTRPVEVQIANR